jgi:hypothetical protein
MDLEKISEEIKEAAFKNFYKEIKNKLYLKDNQISILEKYNIDYTSVSDMKELVFMIEEVLEECFYPEDLEQVSLELSEFNYYNNTNK